MIGKLFGDMEVIDKIDHKYYLVRCSKCGRLTNKRLDHMKENYGVTHENCGRGIKQNDMRFYKIWTSLRERTTNPNNCSYKNYGCRGINSDKWKLFIDFYDDMYESYLKHVNEFGEKDTTIDRIDVNGNYCKENCRWATWKEQRANKRSNKWFIATSPEGQIFEANNQREFSKEHSLNYKSINLVLQGKRKTHKGWKFTYK